MTPLYGMSREALEGGGDLSDLTRGGRRIYLRIVTCGDEGKRSPLTGCWTIADESGGVVSSRARLPQLDGRGIGLQSDSVQGLRGAGHWHV
ncbi:hypothetical protein ElyMa_003945700 [Elysia marginata]|uniref:Uncharacterized protein n=1 Tax=Elysia marginata TaxID=1093978 RepID=A0AAV4FUV3_9GAST|nr:hypothetical protein ElyMa_003945700 [Elysia marginata]